MRSNRSNCHDTVCICTAGRYTVKKRSSSCTGKRPTTAPPWGVQVHGESTSGLTPPELPKPASSRARTPPPSNHATQRRPPRLRRIPPVQGDRTSPCISNARTLMEVWQRPWPHLHGLHARPRFSRRPASVFGPPRRSTDTPSPEEPPSEAPMHW